MNVLRVGSRHSQPDLLGLQFRPASAKHEAFAFEETLISATIPL